MVQSFDLEKLIVDVFAPRPGEKVLVMSDLPHGELTDTEEWAERREMAVEWHSEFQQLRSKRGFSVDPLLTYAATGANNAPLPEEAEMEGQQVHFEHILSDTNIVVALTEYSATAPLIGFTQRLANLRCASMPGVMRCMEQTALAADYSEVARKSHVLAGKLDQAGGAKVKFSTGHEMYFDLRNRKAQADDGQLRADKKGTRLINLPSGEACIAPYEGETEGQPSRTEGVIPAKYDDELVVFRVQENRIVEVMGDGPRAAHKREYFAVDEARRNIAELGLGCNDSAVISGSVLEDEKVLGLHWAYGRSDHLGGTVGVADFSDPDNVVHQDIVYAKGGAIEVASLVLEYEDGASEEIIKDGQYTIF
jgi:leucyl aminopeptidase (aminopeptidase T)